MAIKDWKKLDESNQGITYGNKKEKIVLDILTPYRFEKNSFVMVTKSGKGTTAIINKVSMTKAKQVANAYMRTH